MVFSQSEQSTLYAHVHLEVQAPATGIRTHIRAASGSSRWDDLSTCSDGPGLGGMQMCVMPVSAVALFHFTLSLLLQKV